LIGGNSSKYLKQILLLLFRNPSPCVFNFPNYVPGQRVIVYAELNGASVCEFESILKEIHEHLTYALTVKLQVLGHPFLHREFQLELLLFARLYKDVKYALCDLLPYIGRFDDLFKAIGLYRE